MTYAHETPFTHVYDKFEHYAEDFECSLCANFESRNAARLSDGHGCGRTICEFQDLKDEAIRQNRLKRPKGWWKGTCPEA